MAEGWKAGTEMLGFVAVAGVIGGIVALPFGLAAGLAIGIGAAAGTKVIGDEILRVTSGTDIIGNLVGVGRYGGMRTPVKIFPLMRMGAPWTASLRGFGRGTKDPYGFIWEGLQRGRNQVKDAKEAAAFLWDEFWAARGFEAETAFGTGSLEEVARNLEAKAKASARARSR
jgi:hypothetical protein